MSGKKGGTLPRSIRERLPKITGVAYGRRLASGAGRNMAGPWSGLAPGEQAGWMRDVECYFDLLHGRGYALEHVDGFEPDPMARARQQLLAYEAVESAGPGTPRWIDRDAGRAALDLAMAVPGTCLRYIGPDPTGHEARMCELDVVMSDYAAANRLYHMCLNDAGDILMGTFEDGKAKLEAKGVDMDAVVRHVDSQPLPSVEHSGEPSGSEVPWGRVGETR